MNISEQQLIDCSHQEGNHGCGGGIMDYGFQYIIDNNGICSEEDYPYQATDGICQDCEPIVQIERYGNIFPNNEKILKRGVAQQPVSIAIQAIYHPFDFIQTVSIQILIVVPIRPWSSISGVWNRRRNWVRLLVSKETMGTFMG